jgi:tetratricopeptide (TPR) repeat protein/transcriptional regulator with XRE-family HTH domain
MTARQPSAFGTLLRRERKAAGLSQEALAECAALSVNTLGALESGLTQTPRQDTLDLLVDALARARQLTAVDRAKLAADLAHAARLARTAEAPAVYGDPSVSGPPLVGRARELALLDRHLAGTGPPILLLAGEPGIGKSRLLAEATSRAQARGWQVLQGGCQRRGGEEPFAPLLEALERNLHRQNPAQRRDAVQGCAWLGRLLPELTDGLFEPLPGWTLSPEQERRLVFKAVLRYLANVGGAAGTLLVLDDLQWAGYDALDLLAALARAAADAPLLMVCAYRDTEAPPNSPLSITLADLAQAGLALHRKLGPLTAAEVEQLLDQFLTGGESTDSTLRERVAQRTGGVPFFVVSCAQALGGEEGTSVEQDVLPWTVAQSVRQRVAALPEVARELLGVAAVIGRVVPHALLVAVTARPEQEVVSAVETACWSSLLEQEGADAYRFTHDVIREVVETDLVTARRLNLHRRIAEALEVQPGAPEAELLAYHYGRSGTLDKAVTYLKQAADRAWTRHANVAAESYYRELEDGLDRLGRSLDAAGAREQLGLVLRTVGRYDEALTVLDRAVEGYRAAGDLESLGRALAELGRVHAMRGTPSEGIDRLQPLLGSLAAQAPTHALATLYASLAELYVYTGRYDEELAAATQAAEVAGALQDEPILTLAMYHQGMALAFEGHTEKGLYMLEAAMARAEAASDLPTLCEILDFMGYFYILRGQFDVASGHYERAVAWAQQLGDPGWIGILIGHRGAPAFLAGHWDQARVDFEQGVALSRQVRSSMLLVYILVWRGWLRLGLGEWAAAVKDLEEDLALVEPMGDLDVLRGVQSRLAEYDLLTGRPEAALARLIPLLDRPGLEELGVTGLLPILGWAYLELGDMASAVEMAAQAVRRARSQSHRLAWVDALRVLAMAAMRRQAWAEARQALDEGLSMARAMPYPYAEARLLHVYGLIHAQVGEPEPARACLEAALVIFRRLGARKDLEQAEQLLATFD